jgi:hypothetical protein
VGPFWQLAELIDPPFADGPIIQINRRRRGNMSDDLHKWEISRFVAKAIAEGRSKNQAKALAMTEFGIEKTALERILGRNSPHRQLADGTTVVMAKLKVPLKSGNG